MPALPSVSVIGSRVEPVALQRVFAHPYQWTGRSNHLKAGVSHPRLLKLPMVVTMKLFRFLSHFYPFKRSYVKLDTMKDGAK